MTFDKKELGYIRLAAGIVGFVGMAGLLALLAQDAFAADPQTPAPKGLQPGARTFNNAFMPPSGQPPAPKAGVYEDEEDEEPDFPPDSAVMPPPMPSSAGNPSAFPSNNSHRASPPPPTSSVSAGGAPASANGPDPKFVPGGVSVGGSTVGGIVENNKQKAIAIDDETGEGSKDIVTDFNYPDADIMDIAKTLGRLTGKNFIIDKEVKGRITVISNGPITVGDAWKAFLTALDMNGFALIPSGKYIRIARQRDARDKQLKTYTGDFSPDTDALITRVFPLKYINAEEVARTFRSFMPANSRIIPYDQTNTVIVTDTGSNIAKLNKMLELLDVEGYDAGIEVIPVKFASAAEISKLIDQLLPGSGGAAGGPGGGPRFGGGGGGKFASRRTKEGGIINTIISDDRTNTLIVHANTKGGDQVRELVAKLDQKNPAVTGGGKVHVIYLQFAEAEQIANTLNNISSQSGGGGFKPVSVGGGGGTGLNPVSQSLFEGSIKVSPDKATNSLVVTASPADFVTVQRVINRIDIPRDEVFVEAVIMEVSLSRGSDYSANIASPTSGIGSIVNGDLASFIANPLSATGMVLGFAGGKSSTITVNNQQVTVSSVQGLIKAIQTNSKSNVLATPQIIALDNTEAVFESTDKIPVPSFNSSPTTGTTASITKENVTLSIKIKPQINKVSNFVKLDTEVKIGDLTTKLVAEVNGVKVPSTLERSAKATVVVGDGDTLVLGGLIRDKTTEATNKIPLLGDIPVLGWLFKSRTTTIDKTNLLIFLTPHIIRQYDKVRAILDKKLKERDDFLEKEAGGEDMSREARDKMIRNLPDVAELMNKKPQTSVSIDEDAPTPAAREVQPTSSLGGSNPAPVIPAGSGTSGALPNGAGKGADLTIPSMPSSKDHTSSVAEPAGPLPPAPGPNPGGAPTSSGSTTGGT